MSKVIKFRKKKYYVSTDTMVLKANLYDEFNFLKDDLIYNEKLLSNTKNKTKRKKLEVEIKKFKDRLDSIKRMMLELLDIEND